MNPPLFVVYSLAAGAETAILMPFIRVACRAPWLLTPFGWALTVLLFAGFVLLAALAIRA